MDISKQITQQQPEQQPLTPPAASGFLNYTIPCFSVLARAASIFFGFDISGMTILGQIVSLVTFCRFFRLDLWSFLNNLIFSSVSVRTDDEVYNMVMLWVARQEFAHNARHVFANTNVYSRNRIMYPIFDAENNQSDDDDDQGAHVDVTTGASSFRKQALHYTPSYGSHLFWYKKQPLFFERLMQAEQQTIGIPTEKEEIRIWCLGTNPGILKELMLDARQLHKAKDAHKTVIFRASMTEKGWQRCMSRLNRPLSTVILKEDVKQGLIDDAADYLKPTTREWYANRGIPYRRGYLLYGPPGTGKSSLSVSLAGHFGLKIYIVSLSSGNVTDDYLSRLFQQLPSRCIVLLEDIDSAGLTHTREGEAIPSDTQRTSAATGSANGSAPRSQGPVSLSGLLNVLDGVASQEGRILIMTTNHIEKLDKALIRPGRVDMRIRFGLADSAMAAAIFRAIYAPGDAEETTLKAEDEIGSDLAELKDTLDEKLTLFRERINEQARIFGEKIPAGEFSPAEIQGLLLRHKSDLEGALTSVESWVAAKREEREEAVMKEADKARREEEDAQKKQEEKMEQEQKKQEQKEQEQKDDKEQKE
ncbi:hypothetical protein E4U54_007588 [Claviceps lovelessii]|nr:hypothetical protein E4U54_007588 [Claviceps lovelessii]